MGYTHYWYRVREIEKTTFSKIVDDFKTLLPLFKVLDMKLADGRGEGIPIINNDEVIFNGNAHCGHPRRDLGIAWASDKTKNGVAPNGSNPVVSSWFAGLVLNQRTCDGDCSHETFYFPRVLKSRYEQYHNRRKELLFSFTKTAFKPYDLAVICFLIIAKHHLQRKILVSSDGVISNWKDAMQICQNALKYGNDFILDD